MDKFKEGMKKLLKGKEDEPWMKELREEAHKEAITELKTELKAKYKDEEKKKILEGKKSGIGKAMNTLSKGFVAKDGSGLNSKGKIEKMLGSLKSKGIGSKNVSGMINISKIMGGDSKKQNKKRSIAEMMR